MNEQTLQKQLLTKRKRLFVVIRMGFSYIAFWQLAAFTVLLLTIWVNEIMDFPSLFFGEKGVAFSVYRGCVLSAAVLITAVVTVGHTYIQQQRIVGGILTICCYCRKIRIDHEAWQRVEEYIGRNSGVTFSHGICPDCYHNVMEDLQDEGTRSGATANKKAEGTPAPTTSC